MSRATLGHAATYALEDPNGRSPQEGTAPRSPAKTARLAEPAVAIAPFSESEEFAHWFARSLEIKVHALRGEISGEHPTHDRPLGKLADDEVCWFDDAVQIIRDEEQRAIPYKKALAMFLERATTENRVGKAGRPLITIDHCPDCKRATRRINGGDVPVSESHLNPGRPGFAADRGTTCDQEQLADAVRAS